MKSPIQEENEDLVKEFLAEVEIACVDDLIWGDDWEAVSIILGDLLGKLITRVRADEVEKSNRVWSVYMVKVIEDTVYQLKAIKEDMRGGK